MSAHSLKTVRASKPFDVRHEYRLEHLAGWYLVCLSELLGWHAGRKYLGHSLNRRDTDWLLVVRSERRGYIEVCFIEGRTAPDAIKRFGNRLYLGILEWKISDYQ